MVRIESVSFRVGAEDAETKLSFDDLESAVEGLMFGSSSIIVFFDSSCPSLLATSDRLWWVRIVDAAVNFSERSLLFLGGLGRESKGFAAVVAGVPGGFCALAWSSRLFAFA